MQDAATILRIIRERSERGLPLINAYRMLYNPTFYLYAYGRISSNTGAMTPGITAETVDGMSLEKIDAIIALIRREAYVWTPVRRTHIPKKNGKKRPLGIPTWSDKLLQEVMRLILEAHYEPRFSQLSFGFRTDRGCHTAFREISHWTGARWFIEGDIKGCFDNINHEVLLSTLAETIHDSRFLRLIRHMLQAGYMENWTYGKTYSGTPQGGVISPLLSNVYLDKLDQHIEQKLIPAYTKGERRRESGQYNALKCLAQRARRRGDYGKAQKLRQKMRLLPSYDQTDPDFRRLRYVRYADDFLLGFMGPKAEAEEIKDKLRDYLRDTLKLELSQEKTLITHATTDSAHFLGYDVTLQRRDDRLTKGRRATNGKVALRIPGDVVEAYCREYLVDQRPRMDMLLTHESDFTIVDHYAAVFRGIYNYYQLAQNVVWLHRLRFHMENALLHTLARKHKTTVYRIIRRIKTRHALVDGTQLACFEVKVEREGKNPLVARFGGFRLEHRSAAMLPDVKPYLEPHVHRNERVQRLLHETCELCGDRGPVQGHHLRKLADLRRYGRTPPYWVQVMAARKRKTLFICQPCHTAIHQGHMHLVGTTE